MAVNARTEEFQHIEVFDKPALFTNGRIARDTVPKGWYCYLGIVTLLRGLRERGLVSGSEAKKIAARLMVQLGADIIISL